MKKLTIVVATAACLALCAAVWPQGEAVVETPKPTQTTAVNTLEVPVVAPKEKAKVLPQTEKENTELSQPELPQEIDPEPGPTPTETAIVPEVEVQPMPEPKTTPEPAQDPARCRRLLTRNPATWSMLRALAGWKAKAKAWSFMMT